MPAYAAGWSCKVDQPLLEKGNEAALAAFAMEGTSMSHLTLQHMVHKASMGNIHVPQRTVMAQDFGIHDLVPFACEE